MSLAVLLGGAMLVMTSVGIAAVEYGAYRWPNNWGQADASYRNGYVAGVMDTLTYSRYAGVSVNALNSAWTCQNTKGLTDLQVVKTVDAMLAGNPKFEDNIAAAAVGGDRPVASSPAR